MAWTGSNPHRLVKRPAGISGYMPARWCAVCGKSVNPSRAAHCSGEECENICHLNCLYGESEFDCGNTAQLRDKANINSPVSYIEPQDTSPPDSLTPSVPNEGEELRQASKDDLVAMVMSLREEVALEKELVMSYSVFIDRLTEKRELLVDALELVDSVIAVRLEARANIEYKSVECTAKQEEIIKEWTDHIAAQEESRLWWSSVCEEEQATPPDKTHLVAANTPLHPNPPISTPTSPPTVPPQTPDAHQTPSTPQLAPLAQTQNIHHPRHPTSQAASLPLPLLQTQDTYQPPNTSHSASLPSHIPQAQDTYQPQTTTHPVSLPPHLPQTQHNYQSPTTPHLSSLPPTLPQTQTTQLPASQPNTNQTLQINTSNPSCSDPLHHTQTPASLPLTAHPPTNQTPVPHPTATHPPHTLGPCPPAARHPTNLPQATDIPHTTTWVRHDTQTTTSQPPHKQDTRQPAQLSLPPQTPSLTSLGTEGTPAHPHPHPQQPGQTVQEDQRRSRRSNNRRGGLPNRLKGRPEEDREERRADSGRLRLEKCPWCHRQGHSGEQCPRRLTCEYCQGRYHSAETCRERLADKRHQDLIDAVRSGSQETLAVLRATAARPSPPNYTPPWGAQTIHPPGFYARPFQVTHVPNFLPTPYGLNDAFIQRQPGAARPL